MKENPYDNPQFFWKYSQMLRSTQGLAGAGEWRELEKLLPDFTGKRVLDLGCGYGWHCAYAAGHKAAYVLGTDLSEKMLETARHKNSAPQIEYRRSAMEDLIKAKGFEQCVVYLGEDSVNVVVQTEGLDAAQAAQIKSVILSQDQDVKAEQISITEVSAP